MCSYLRSRIRRSARHGLPRLITGKAHAFYLHPKSSVWDLVKDIFYTGFLYFHSLHLYFAPPPDIVEEDGKEDTCVRLGGRILLISDLTRHPKPLC